MFSLKCRQPLYKNQRRSRGGMRLTTQLAIRCLIANYCTRWCCNFKGLSQDGGRAEFSKNLRASLFNDDLWNEPYLGRIHLAGQYLLWSLLRLMIYRKNHAKNPSSGENPLTNNNIAALVISQNKFPPLHPPPSI